MPKYNDFELDIQVNLIGSRPGSTNPEPANSIECGQSDYCVSRTCSTRPHCPTPDDRTL